MSFARDGRDDRPEWPFPGARIHRDRRRHGIVLTKLDGTAKGGIVVAITRELGLPVQYVAQANRWKTSCRLTRKHSFLLFSIEEGVGIKWRML